MSYEGGLLPTESVPIGQIPHALVVPYAELTLDEMIGTGAEGKVGRRGRSLHDSNCCRGANQGACGALRLCIIVCLGCWEDLLPCPDLT